MSLTRKHHFQYMGMWILITVCLLIMFNTVLYMLLEARWNEMQSLTGSLVEVGEMADRLPFLIGAVVVTLLFIGAATFLAMSTAHRIAGPYVRLKNAFRAVRDGNLDLHLEFRGYDRLEDVAEAFNEMLGTIRAKMDESGGSPR